MDVNHKFKIGDRVCIARNSERIIPNIGKIGTIVEYISSSIKDCMVRLDGKETVDCIYEEDLDLID